MTLQNKDSLVRKMPQAFITKSSFIQGYDCPLRLKYAVQKTFASTSQGDDFLRLLADGGFQFEKLVRHAWPGDTLGGFPDNAAASHDKTMTALRACLKAGKGVLHEAVFICDNLFVRVDMLRINGNTLELCEVKAKSYEGPYDSQEAKSLISCKGNPDDINTSMLNRATKKLPSLVRPSWLEYIADIGFQTIVVERALAAENMTGLTISPRLLVANINQSACEYDWFGNVLPVIDLKPDLRFRGELHLINKPPMGWRSPLIAELNVQEAIDMLRKNNAQSGATRWQGMTLDEIVDDASKLIQNQEGVDPATERGWKCRGCQYNTPAKGNKQCGFDLCWGAGAKSAQNLFQLYYGKTYTPPEHKPDSAVNEYVEWINNMVTANGTKKPLHVADMEPEQDDIGSPMNKPRVHRRRRQIQAEKENKPQFSDQFAEVVKARLMPKSGTGILRFMDFETTSSCLPYVIGMKPYQVVAFQFSVHSLVVKGGRFDLSKIEHVEKLCIGSSKDTDIHVRDVEFATELRKALTQPWQGVHDETSPVFHWSSHERTIMRMLSERLDDVGNHDELVEWLNATCLAEHNDPPGRLVDLLKIAEANTFHPLQQGQFSIKKFLPALCSEPDTLAVLRGLGFTTKIDPAEDGRIDPYKGLPSLSSALSDTDTGLVMNDDDENEEESHVGEGIRTGTDAMRAYQQLRFPECVEWKDANKKPIDNKVVEKNLLLYCKLDTAAMVAVWWWLWSKAGATHVLEFKT